MDVKIYAKEFVYRSEITPKTPIKLVAEGELQDRRFFIVDNTSHPTCYISMPEGIEKKRVVDDHRCPWPHGGVTYFGPLPAGLKAKYPDDGRTYAGWDYAHTGDFIATPIQIEWPAWWKKELDQEEPKKWTVEEVLEEVRIFILQFNAWLVL